MILWLLAPGLTTSVSCEVWANVHTLSSTESETLGPELHFNKLFLKLLRPKGGEPGPGRIGLILLLQGVSTPGKPVQILYHGSSNPTCWKGQKVVLMSYQVGNTLHEGPDGRHFILIKPRGHTHYCCHTKSATIKTPRKCMAVLWVCSLHTWPMGHGSYNCALESKPYPWLWSSCIYSYHDVPGLHAFLSLWHLFDYKPSQRSKSVGISSIVIPVYTFLIIVGLIYISSTHGFCTFSPLWFWFAYCHTSWCFFLKVHSFVHSFFHLFVHSLTQYIFLGCRYLPESEQAPEVEWWLHGEILPHTSHSLASVRIIITWVTIYCGLCFKWLSDLPSLESIPQPSWHSVFYFLASPTTQFLVKFRQLLGTFLVPSHQLPGVLYK